VRSDKSALLLYAVTERSYLKGCTLEEAVEEACKNGATMVQIREKQMGDQDFLAEAAAIKKITDRYCVGLIINDNVKVAVEIDALGVHVGQSDMQASKARLAIGPEKLLGVSASTLEEARRAVRDGADYLGVGAVFATSTKADAEAVSIDRLKDICENVDVPVVAIGGISEINAHLLRGTGIAGLAVVSAIFAAENIGEATKRLYEIARGVI
jgi:thiamine-phosphate pyrophosphorylase